MIKDFRDRSKERLESEMTKAVHDLMVSCLDRAEKFLKPNTNGEDWRQFRFNVLTLGNDKIRFVKDRLSDYAIEFRPAVLSVKYTIDSNVEAQFDKLIKFSFFFDNGYPMYFVECGTEKVAELFRKNMEVGRVVKVADDKWRHCVDGMYDIFNRVVPFFDSTNSLKGHALDSYKEWKEKVYKMEQGK